MNTLEVKVHKILIQEWDPIGVKDIPEAHDEYDMYVSGICRMLRAGQSSAEIYSHLRWIETERIGLDGNEQHTHRIAAKLFGLVR
ncbi:hypothetical protein PQQ53_08560 [Paraburkholderia strydomiana]|uniref:hypothetical protein n=1 Tax=Paraburkholderia strydomiana TaxID=1245417 RepID=UPI0038B7A7C0